MQLSMVPQNSVPHSIDKTAYPIFIFAVTMKNVFRKVCKKKGDIKQYRPKMKLEREMRGKKQYIIKIAFCSSYVLLFALKPVFDQDYLVM